jgi:putative restriction endonuclease
MNYKRIDALEINYADSSALKKLKIKTIKESKGGEKRLYITGNRDLLDEFFSKGVEYFFFLKKDLVDYVNQAKDEYLNPKQEYREDIKLLYNQNVTNTNSINEERIKMKFSSTYDSGGRYYLVLDKDFKTNYDYARNIMLPRITKLRFLKIESEGKIYIYIKPAIQCIAIKQEDDFTTNQDIEKEEKKSKENARNHQKQREYRLSLFEKMPSCIFTLVSDDRVLQACHIKPFRSCNENEGYDFINGITMTPTYHYLFDIGFISFKDKGELLISPYLSNMNRKRLGLNENAKYQLQKGCEIYLKYHRENIFNKMPDLDNFI